jgi:site-specific recombinase XerC
VKQQLAAVRMLFDWLITGQVMPANPAQSPHRLKNGQLGERKVDAVSGS